MYGSKIDNVVLWRNFLGFIFNDVSLLSLSTKSMVKIIYLGGYVLRIGFLLNYYITMTKIV